MKNWLMAVVVTAPALAQAFDLNGVPLGGREADIKRVMPSAYCKAVDWNTRAADRRCDDAKVLVGGVLTKVAFYLKSDSIQGFEVRFDVNNREKLLAHLKAGWGPPKSDATEALPRRQGGERQVRKVLWMKATEQAMMTAQLDRRRASISAWRGDFREEIYRVR